MMAYITRITQLRKAINIYGNCVIITERSILTDKNVFAKMLHDNDMLDEISHNIYLKWFDELSRGLEIHSFIYIKTNPSTSLKRVLKRNRPGETLTIDYLKICHENHENWLQNCENVLSLNGEKEYIEKIPDEWLFVIKNHLNSIIKPLKEMDIFYNLIKQAEYPIF